MKDKCYLIRFHFSREREIDAFSVAFSSAGENRKSEITQNITSPSEKYQTENCSIEWPNR